MPSKRQQDVAADNEQDRALARYTLLLPQLDGTCSMPELARETGIPERTLWSWSKAFREHGLPGLMRKERSDRGLRRLLHPDLTKVIEGLALRRPAPSIAFVHRQVCALSTTHGFVCPSYATVARVVNAIDPEVRVMAHEGTKAYKQQFDLLYRREASCPNEVWQSDHTPLDLLVVDSHGCPVRPWLTVIMDDFSRAVAGYYLALDDPATWKTALALRQAINRKDNQRWLVFGIPDYFYTDHGSDFTSRRMELVAAHLKMRLINSQVGEPRGRGKIERFFRSVNELFLRGVPGFAPLGHKPKGKLLTLEKLDELFHEWLIDQYQPKVHSEIGVAPQVRWESGSFIPRVPDCPEYVDLLLCTDSKQRKVHRDGIRFYGLRYMDVNLSGYIGEQVTVRFDPRDLAEIRLYQRDEFICKAVCQEIADQVVGLKDIVKARTAERKRVAARIRESAEFLNDFIALHSLGNEHDSEQKCNEEKASLKRYRCD